MDQKEKISLGELMAQGMNEQPEILGASGGLVIENEPIEEDGLKAEYSQFAINHISPDTNDAIMEYMKELDERIETAQENKAKYEEERGPIEEEDDEEDEEISEEDFQEKYDEAIVVIDKSGMGTVIDFTEEERQKLEKVKKIKLEEVETVSLESLVVKKAKKNSLDKVLKRTNNLHTTPVVLLASGYTAVMKGCSTYELVTLFNNTDNILMDTETKWTLIHEKIESTSIGNMDFNTFLQNTAAIDYSIFIYGILCASYPDVDTIPLKCEKCKKEFDHSYTVKSLIRAEKMSEETQELLGNIVDASHMDSTAKEFHEQAPISVEKIIKLPLSGHVVKMYVQSGFDFIKRSIKELSQNDDEKIKQSAILSSLVSSIYVADPDNEGAYLEYDGVVEISKIIYTLQDTDILVLTKQGEKMIESVGIEFGLMDINCPHCKHHTDSLKLDPDSILFYKYQQALTTQID